MPQVDPDLNLVKGRGGALLREKARAPTRLVARRATTQRTTPHMRPSPPLARAAQMVELASKKFVCIVDDTKMVSGLGGSKLAMPVEVTPFCYKARHVHRGRGLRGRGAARARAARRGVAWHAGGCGRGHGLRACLPWLTCTVCAAVVPLLLLFCAVQLGAPAEPAGDEGLRRQGARAPATRHGWRITRVPACPSDARAFLCLQQLRMKEKDIYVTDNGNYIVDLYFETPMKDAVAAGKAISELVGVVEHGLFLNMCDVCIIAGKTGIEVKERKLKR
jgi:ribose 5-phosphate isomerase